MYQSNATTLKRTFFLGSKKSLIHFPRLLTLSRGNAFESRTIGTVLGLKVANIWQPIILVHVFRLGQKAGSSAFFVYPKMSLSILSGLLFVIVVEDIRYEVSQNKIINK